MVLIEIKFSANLFTDIHNSAHIIRKIFNKTLQKNPLNQKDSRQNAKIATVNHTAQGNKKQ